MGKEIDTGNGSYTGNFNYDGAENPTTFRGVSVPTANPDNQIAVASEYVYDGSGNPTTYNSASLVFDPENRMTAYGSVLSCGYTAGGLRAWKANSSGTTYFLYDGTNAVCEMSSTGSVTATNTISPIGLISRNCGGSSVFYSFDAQGSTAQRLTSSGSVLTSGMTDAFGAASGGASTDPFSGLCARFGYYSDAETGLLLLGHRYYDPSQGRFINRDPMGSVGGVNLYGYCNNNSGNISDPSGFCCTPVPPWELTLEIAGLDAALLAVIMAIEVLLGGPEDPFADTLDGCLVRAIAAMYGQIIADLSSGCMTEDEAVDDALMAGVIGCLGAKIPKIINAIPGIVKGIL